MKIYSEISLRDFEFWSGAADRVKYLTSDEMDTIEQMLEEQYPDGIDETELNDFFWFEEDTIAEWLGYSSFDEIMNRDDEEGSEDDDDIIEDEEDDGDYIDLPIYSEQPNEDGSYDIKGYRKEYT